MKLKEPVANNKTRRDIGVYTLHYTNNPRTGRVSVLKQSSSHYKIEGAISVF